MSDAPEMIMVVDVAVTDALVAAAYEAAAREIDCMCGERDKVLAADHVSRWYHCADPCMAIKARNIRNLTPDDARAALDKLIAEAAAKEREAVCDGRL